MLPLLPSSLRRPSPPWRLCPLSRSSAVNTASFRRRSSSTPLLPSLLLLSLLRPPSPPSQEEELPQREQDVVPARPAGPVLDEYDSGVSPWRGSCPPRRQVQLPEAVILRDGGEQLASRHGNGCQSGGRAFSPGQVADVQGPVSCAFSI